MTLDNILDIIKKEYYDISKKRHDIYLRDIINIYQYNKKTNNNNNNINNINDNNNNLFLINKIRDYYYFNKYDLKYLSKRNQILKYT
jgi:uncharacterized protein YehS (DUF1456 family)